MKKLKLECCQFVFVFSFKFCFTIFVSHSKDKTDILLCYGLNLVKGVLARLVF